MAKENETFTEFVERNEGYIFSSGTLRIDALCALSYDLLCNIITSIENKSDRTTMDNVNLEHAKIVHDELRKLFGFEENHHTSEAYEKVVYNEISIEDQLELASNIFIEDVYDLFNTLAPQDYYFGTTEGDGTLFGWFEGEYC